ncbi:hypothetical protein JCM8115_006943 [Rhodotorula mucilaginosa]
MSPSPPTSLPSTPPAMAPTQLLPPLGIATLSLGNCEHHALEDKIRAAAEAGFSSVELFDLDWEHYRDAYARSNGYALPCEEGDAASRAAAHELAKVCRDEGVEISCYQPLRNFEGWLDPEQEEKARKHAKGILDVMPILGTDLVLCCSNAAPATETTGSLEKAAADLGWLADLAATYTPPIRVMYEALSFATHRSQWQQAWEVVEYANRPNLGLCLDSFNALARDWADPYSPSGRRSDDVDAQLERSMNELVQRVPGEKIFLYQVADAAFMSPPMTPPTDPSVPRLRPWSRSHRLFPLERSLGAYLPVDRFSDAVIATGYSGPWSLEVFNWSLNNEGKLVPQQHAERGMKGLHLAATQAYERAHLKNCTSSPVCFVVARWLN